MFKKLMLSLILCTGFLLSASGDAKAHFMVSDQATGMRASFHVTPDHNPIAGKQSVISFDFSRGTTIVDDYNFTMTASDKRTKSAVVPMQLTGRVAIANYVFPTRGVYQITLKAQPKRGGPTSMLSYTQRVSRGTVANESRLGAMQLGIIGGILALAGLAVTATSLPRKTKSVKNI